MFVAQFSIISPFSIFPQTATHAIMLTKRRALSRTILRSANPAKVFSHVRNGMAGGSGVMPPSESIQAAAFGRSTQKFVSSKTNWNTSIAAQTKTGHGIRNSTPLLRHALMTGMPQKSITAESLLPRVRRFSNKPGLLQPGREASTSAAMLRTNMFLEKLFRQNNAVQRNLQNLAKNGNQLKKKAANAKAFISHLLTWKYVVFVMGTQTIVGTAFGQTNIIRDLKTLFEARRNDVYDPDISFVQCLKNMQKDVDWEKTFTVLGMITPWNVAQVVIFALLDARWPGFKDVLVKGVYTAFSAAYKKGGARTLSAFNAFPAVVEIKRQFIEWSKKMAASVVSIQIMYGLYWSQMSTMTGLWKFKSDTYNSDTKEVFMNLGRTFAGTLKELIFGSLPTDKFDSEKGERVPLSVEEENFHKQRVHDFRSKALNVIEETILIGTTGVVFQMSFVPLSLRKYWVAGFSLAWSAYMAMKHMTVLHDHPSATVENTTQHNTMSGLFGNAIVPVSAGEIMSTSKKIIPTPKVLAATSGLLNADEDDDSNLIVLPVDIKEDALKDSSQPRTNENKQAESRIVATSVVKKGSAGDSGDVNGSPTQFLARLMTDVKNGISAFPSPSTNASITAEKKSKQKPMLVGTVLVPNQALANGAGEMNPEETKPNSIDADEESFWPDPQFWSQFIDRYFMNPPPGFTLLAPPVVAGPNSGTPHPSPATANADSDASTNQRVRSANTTPLMIGTVIVPNHEDATKSANENDRKNDDYVNVVAEYAMQKVEENRLLSGPEINEAEKFSQHLQKILNNIMLVSL